MWCTCDCCFSMKNVKKAVGISRINHLLYVHSCTARNGFRSAKGNFLSKKFSLFTFFSVFSFLEFHMKSTTSVILWMYIIASFWYVSHTSFFLFPKHSLTRLFFTYVSIIFWWCSLFLISVRDVFDSFVSCLLFYRLVLKMLKNFFISHCIFLEIWKNENFFFFN